MVTFTASVMPVNPSMYIWTTVLAWKQLMLLVIQCTQQLQLPPLLIFSEHVS